MSESLPALGAAFLTGFLGSAHCIGMCAGISGLFAAQLEIASLRSRLPMALVYNLGRIASYAALGFVVGLLGSGAVAGMPSLAGPVRIVSGIIIVLIGLQIAFDWRFLRPIERMGAVIWARLAPAAKGLLPVTNLPRALGLGLLWGWLPCGLVYSVLLLAATSPQAADGGLVMFAFGVGTLPAMLATGLGAAKLSQLLQRRGARLGLGLLIVILGLITLAMPVLGLFPSEAQHHH